MKNTFVEDDKDVFDCEEVLPVFCGFALLLLGFIIGKGVTSFPFLSKIWTFVGCIALELLLLLNCCLRYKLLRYLDGIVKRDVIMEEAMLLLL